MYKGKGINIMRGTEKDTQREAGGERDSHNTYSMPCTVKSTVPSSAKYVNPQGKWQKYSRNRVK